jgi:cobalamin biosynthesis protein CobT
MEEVNLSPPDRKIPIVAADDSMSPEKAWKMIKTAIAMIREVSTMYLGMPDMTNCVAKLPEVLRRDWKIRL